MPGLHGTLDQYFSDPGALLPALANQEHGRMTRLFAHRHGKFTGSATTVCAYGDQLLCAAARRHAQFVLMARLATPDGQPFGEVFIKRVSIFWSRRDAGQHALTSQTHACVLGRTILSLAQTTALENSQ